MDDKGFKLPKTVLNTPPQPLSSANIAGDLEHINREMYKKNIELLERNRTLSILQKIDGIALSAVTNVKEIGANVTKVLINEAGFKLAGILLVDQTTNNLVVASLAEAEAVLTSEMFMLENASFISNIPMSDDYNVLVQVVKQKQPKVTNNYHDIAFHAVTPEQAKKIQDASGMQSFVVHPMIIRDQVIGLICIGLAEDEKTLSEYTRDLINRLIGVVGISIDNALLYNQVKSANEKLQALDKLKDEFVSMASHELRTPMTAIKSYLWMLLAGKAGVLNEKQHFYLDRAFTSTDRLLVLVNDMLNISRIESGRITLDMQQVKLDEIAEDVVLEVMPKAEELGLHIAVQKVQGMPPVFADPDKMKEVFSNLLGNAMKFTQKDGSITISFRVLDRTVEVSITDSGAGIAPEDLTKLFQKFSLLPGSYATSKTDIPGTGLGLYICKSIVELHHGSIQATSPGVGKGTTITMMIPIFDEKAWKKYQGEQPRGEKSVS